MHCKDIYILLSIAHAKHSLISFLESFIPPIFRHLLDMLLQSHVEAIAPWFYGFKYRSVPLCTLQFLLISNKSWMGGGGVGGEQCGIVTLPH